MMELLFLTWLMPTIVGGFILTFSLIEFRHFELESASSYSAGAYEFLSSIFALKDDGHVGIVRMVIIVLLSASPLVNWFIVAYGVFWATVHYLGWYSEDL